MDFHVVVSVFAIDGFFLFCGALMYALDLILEILVHRTCRVDLLDMDVFLSRKFPMLDKIFSRLIQSYVFLMLALLTFTLVLTVVYGMCNLFG